VRILTLDTLFMSEFTDFPISVDFSVSKDKEPSASRRCSVAKTSSSGVDGPYNSTNAFQEVTFAVEAAMVSCPLELESALSACVESAASISVALNLFSARAASAARRLCKAEVPAACGTMAVCSFCVAACITGAPEVDDDDGVDPTYEENVRQKQIAKFLGAPKHYARYAPKAVMAQEGEVDDTDGGAKFEAWIGSKSAKNLEASYDKVMPQNQYLNDYMKDLTH